MPVATTIANNEIHADRSSSAFDGGSNSSQASLKLGAPSKKSSSSWNKAGSCRDECCYTSYTSILFSWKHSFVIVILVESNCC